MKKTLLAILTVASAHGVSAAVPQFMQPNRDGYPEVKPNAINGTVFFLK